MENKTEDSSIPMLFVTTSSVMLGVLSYGIANISTEIMKNNGVTNKFVLNFGIHALSAAAATGIAVYGAKIIAKSHAEKHMCRKFLSNNEEFKIPQNLDRKNPLYVPQYDLLYSR